MTDELLFSGLTIFLFLLVSAFFSAAETALTAISRPRIYQLVMDGSKRAKIVSKLRREKEALISTVLIGNNAVNIGASAMATSLAIRMLGDEGGLLLVTGVMTLIVVVFCEVLPKTYAIQNAERVSLKVAPAVQLFVTLLWPLTKTIHIFIRMLLRIFGIDITKSGSLMSTTDILRGTIELHHREGKMVKQDRDMLGSILDLNDIEVEEIMIHRKHVDTIDADLPTEDIVAQAAGILHSRIPLWRGEPDNIIGVMHVKSLIRLLNQQKDITGRNITIDHILGICSKPWFIPETTTLRDQLLAFRSKRQHFAFVVDEYGGWQGIVTLEDIIEEIVGDIDDEHDEADSDIQKAGDNAYYIHGSVTLRDINRQLGWNLPDDNASTIAGLLIHEAQTIPSIGEQFNVHGFRFSVIAKDAMQITRLRIEKLPDTVLPRDVEV